MIFSQNRETLRQMYRDAWNKHQNDLPMTPLEIQISQVLLDHPEYHAEVLGQIDKDYLPGDGQTNPYLHLSLHLAVRDQIITNRPPGIRAAFDALCRQNGDAHRSEHQMTERMAEELWRAQNASTPPDEQNYLNNINKLLKK